MTNGWNTVGPITTKQKAPSSGINTMTQAYGKPFCKDICSRYSSGRPIGKAYETHHFCTRCGVWLEHSTCPIVKLTPRCPCCKMRVKTKSVKRKYPTIGIVG